MTEAAIVAMVTIVTMADKAPWRFPIQSRMYVNLHVKGPILLFRFNKNWHMSRKCSKNSPLKNFIENPFDHS